MLGKNIRRRFRFDEILVPETLTAFCARQKPKTFRAGARTSHDNSLIMKESVEAFWFIKWP